MSVSYTHDFELKIGDHNFTGKVEINNAGVVSYKPNPNSEMPKKTKNVLESVLDLLGTLPIVYTDLKKFKLKIK